MRELLRLSAASPACAKRIYGTMVYARIFLSCAFLIYVVSFLVILQGVRWRGYDPLGKAVGSPGLASLVTFATLSWQLLVVLCILGADRIVSWGRIELPFDAAVGVFGSLLFAAGLALAICGAVTLRESFRLGLPHEKSPLVTTGVYRYSRNPVMLGLYGYVWGSFLLVPGVTMLASAVLNLVAYHLKVLGEERYLRSTHGDEYEGYCRRVPRYFPRPHLGGLRSAQLGTD